jgi:hypothetical protein
MGCFNLTSKTPQRLCHAGPVVAFAFIFLSTIFLAGTTLGSDTAVEDGCMEELYDEFGQGGGLNCTANDVSIAGITDVTITDDGCAFPGDQVTFNATLKVLLTATARHDIGIYLATDGGNALTGDCLVDILPYQPNLEDCIAAGYPYTCCTGPEAGTCDFADIDGTRDDTNNSDAFGYCADSGGNLVIQNGFAFPCNEHSDCDTAVGETCEEFGPGLQDLCGDIVDSGDPRNPILTDFTDITILCLDNDGDGFADLPNCTSWRIPGANDLCLSPLAAYPGAPSKCRCGVINISEIPVPKTIEVVKDLTPDNDPGLFDLKIDGVTKKTDASEGDSTGPVSVTTGTHSVSESEGFKTDLSFYATDITCVDTVGRCTGDNTIHCLTDPICEAEGAGTCNTNPTQVAACTDCNTLNVAVPDEQSAIVCIIANENIAGKIIVEKQTDPEGDTQQFPFSGDLLGTIGDGETLELDVAPGQYTSTETVPAGWDLTSIICDDDASDTPSTIDLENETATFNVEANETVKCTFTNTKRGTIIVEKQTDPDGDTQLFTFSGDAAGSISDGQKIEVNGLSPGTYSSTETVPAGWDLTSINCDDGDSDTPSTVEVENAKATFELDPGETVTCTFNNTIKRGKIIVQKETDPDGSSQLFDFSTDYGTSFQLSDGQQNDSGPLLPGTYSVSETVPAGWELKSATCDDGSDPSAIGLDPDETVTCTFTNEQDANIIVKKETDPDGSDQLFDFTPTGYGSAFQLKDGQQNDSGALDPGTYSVAETVPAGWELKSTSCVSSKGDTETAANISLQAGETVTCTFTNEQDANIIVKKETDPDGSDQLFDFTPTGYGSAFQLKDGQQNDSGALDPGTYSVAETVPAGWELKSTSCVSSKGDTETAANISLQAGETVTCTFENSIQRGNIVVVKWTDPDGSTTNFGFTSNYSAGFNLADGESNDSGPLVPSSEGGNYWVSESTIPEGWELLMSRCVGAGDRVIPAANIDLQPDETVTCTFTNEQDAFIVIQKVTDPDGSTQEFGFTASYNTTGFSLSDGESNTSVALDPGTYSVSEDVPDGWELKSATCDNGDDPSSIGLAAGETVTCTFENEQDAFIIVDKVTNPAGSDQLFTFSTSYSADFQLADATPPDNSGDLDPGTYSVSETVPDGWDLTSATCDDGSDPGSISLQAGETVTCTFNNRERAMVDVLKLTNGLVDPTKSWSFELYEGPDGFGGTSLASDNTSGDQDGVLEFGQIKLNTEDTFTLCELEVAAGYSTFWQIDTNGDGTGDVTVVPYNPNADDNPPQDLGNRCVDFGANTSILLEPGTTLHFVVDNQQPGGAPRTPGYWKNWNRCTGGGQQYTADANGGWEEGFWLLEDVLDPSIGGGITWDDILNDDYLYPISSCEIAVDILDKRLVDDPEILKDGKKKSSDPLHNLAAHLLAAQLNFGAGACTTQEVLDAALEAEELLDKYNFDHDGHDRLSKKSSDADLANELANYLDRYNNGEFCGDFDD